MQIIVELSIVVVIFFLVYNDSLTVDAPAENTIFSKFNIYAKIYIEKNK
jgi:hypothetical protein